MMKTNGTSSAPRRAAGFTLVEAVVSMALVGLLLTGALAAVASTARVKGRLADAATGRFLAQGLLAEVLGKGYADPQGGPGGLGADAGEAAMDKAGFDDVDDYEGWTESPPLGAAGAPVGGLARWRRSVKVEWVLASDPDVAATSETGVKRVTVTARHADGWTCVRVGLRTAAP